MKKMKKYLILCLVVALALSMALAGCSKSGESEEPGGGSSSADNSGADNSSSNDATPTEPEEETVELTWYLVGPRQEPDTDKVLAEANAYIKDKINATVDLQVFGYGDAYDQKVNTMLAAGEAFDICFTANWAADYRNNSNSGYFKQLDEYLKKYPAVTEVVGQDFLNGVAVDGKTFAVPCNKEKVHNWGFLLKKDLVDKYNVDTDNIKSMDDLEPYFEQIKKGEVGITPLLSVQMEAPFKLLDWDNISDDDVPGALYPDNRDTKIVNQFTAPESIAHYKKMREYFEKGYVSPDAATMENFSDQLKTGKYFAAVQSLKPGKDAEMLVSTGIEWVQVDITTPVMSNRETTGSLLAIPANSKNPEKAFQFIELLYTDKYVNNLFVYGIEDEHYEKVSGNVVSLLGGDNSGYTAGNGWRFGDQFKNYLMDNEDPEKWDKFIEYNSKGIPLNSLGFAFDSTSVDTEISACTNVIQAYYKQLFTGSVDIDSTIQRMESELEAAGVNTVLEEMQTQFDNWYNANK